MLFCFVSLNVVVSHFLMATIIYYTRVRKEENRMKETQAKLET